MTNRARQLARERNDDFLILALYWQTPCTSSYIDMGSTRSMAAVTWKKRGSL